MRTAIIGTAKGIFVVDAASGASSPALEGPSVRHLSRVTGHCVAGSTAGFFRSADAGRSWQPSGIGDREVWDVAAAPGDAATLYAVTEPAGLFLSRDGGVSWTEIAGFRAAPGFTEWCVPVTPPRPGRARSVVLAPADPLPLVVGVDAGGAVPSEAGRRTWTMNRPRAR